MSTRIVVVPSRGARRRGPSVQAKVATAVAAGVAAAILSGPHTHAGAAGPAVKAPAAIAAQDAATRTVAIPALGTTLPPEQVMIRLFGQPGDPSREETVPFAGHSVQVNALLAANVRALGAALAKAGYSGYIRDVGGFRDSVGASGSPIPFSMHQFGAAFDINEDGLADGNWQTMRLPARLVRIAASFGWFCGQSWGWPSTDGGHFQFTGGRKVTVAGGRR